jgi:hypothetical protein
MGEVGSVSLKLKALAIAGAYVGVRETSRNSGPEIDEFLRSVNLQPGEPWCAAFIFWVFAKAAGELGLVNPVPRTGSSLRVWTLAEPVARDSNPQPGFVYILKHSPTTGHVGIVESVQDYETITELSGNTNEQGSREGNAVARHTGRSPEAIHGGELQGYLDFDRCAQAPPGFTT